MSLWNEFKIILVNIIVFIMLLYYQLSIEFVEFIDNFEFIFIKIYFSKFFNKKS